MDPERPIGNVWLGVSVEDQKWADIRIPALLDTPAAVRFLSCEPLLGPIDLSAYLNPARRVPGCNCAGTVPGYPQHESYCGWEPDEDAARPDWVIVGGESGPGARPMHPGWVRAIRDACEIAPSTAFFFKQWGAWAPLKQLPSDVSPTLTTRRTVIDGKDVFRIGKHAAGRLLDGRTWDEYPAMAVAV
jgi:protein gp37